MIGASLGRGIPHLAIFDSLVGGNSAEVLARIDSRTEIHDPHAGRIRGVDAIARYLDDRAAWLASTNAVAIPLDYTEDVRLSLEEVDIELDGPEGRATMPTAVVIEQADDGAISELRMYFSAWFRRGEQTTRSPLLPVDGALRGPEIVERYHELLAEGDGPALGELFAKDSYVREPMGTIAVGLSEVQRWHRQFAEGDGSGMPLHWCSRISDGRVVAFEYMADQWGTRHFAPIGGLS
ncbi:MAG: nuclear transport factor 2 family protein, partial [Microbacterium sp.]|uniref:hypothetical protein n=1 Tax=Microbacterium sp. TaxID=51671 RepID=UPI003BAED47F